MEAKAVLELDSNVESRAQLLGNGGIFKSFFQVEKQRLSTSRPVENDIRPVQTVALFTIVEGLSPSATRAKSLNLPSAMISTQTDARDTVRAMYIFVFNTNIQAFNLYIASSG